MMRGSSSDASDLVVELLGVSVELEGKQVLKDVSLELGRGVHVILGANGSGKTTLLKTIAGLIKPASGKVLVFGREVSTLSRREASRLIGYCWQNPLYGFFEETVEREVRFILENLGVSGEWSFVSTLGVEELMDRSPFSLSGGEAKRVSIASVIVADQPVLLLDEPFEGLDYRGVKSLVGLVERFRLHGKTVLLATHNPLIADKLKPDTYTILHEGMVKAHGSWPVSDEILEQLDITPRRWWLAVTA